MHPARREGAPYTEVRRLYTMSSRAAHTAGAAAYLFYINAKLIMGRCLLVNPGGGRLGFRLSLTKINNIFYDA